MKKSIIFALAAVAVDLMAHAYSGGPGPLTFYVETRDGVPSWRASYGGEEFVGWSPLGLVTDQADFTKDVKMSEPKASVFRDSYSVGTIKKKNVKVEMLQLETVFTAANGRKLGFEARIGANDIAFRYKLMQADGEKTTVVRSEATGFAFRADARKFMTPQSKPMTGWCKTKPCYEERYVFDAPVAERSQYGEGWTFPALVRLPKQNEWQSSMELWSLVGETGTDGNYCACHLSDWDGKMFRIAFPMAGEARGEGSVEPTCTVPSSLPWRTLTVGNTLKLIVETTVAWDVVKPLVPAPAKPYKFGKGSWSWIVWDDPSMNPVDQRKFIVIARRSGGKWHVAGVAAEDTAAEIDLGFAGGKRETVTIKRNDGFVRVL